MKKMILATVILAVSTMLAGCTVLSSAGEEFGITDNGSYGGHSHH